MFEGIGPVHARAGMDTKGRPMDDTTMNAGMGQPGDRLGDIPGGPIEKTEGMIRRLFLAGVGAAAVALDTAEERYAEFVRRGEQVQQEMQERSRETRQRNMGAGSRVADSFRTGMDSILNGLNLPSKTDVDTMNVKLNILTRKLDDLQMEQSRRGTETVTEIILPTEEQP